MGQSNFNRAAIKAKENGANDKSKLEPVHKTVLIVLGALFVAAMIFATLVAFDVITCTNASTMLAEGTNGEKLYVSTITGTDEEGNPAYQNLFYYMDAEGKRHDLHFSEELNDVCYYDEEGNEHRYMIEAGPLGESVDGVTLYTAYSLYAMNGAGEFTYYFFDENGQRVDCHLSEDNSQIFYTDAEGNEKEFVLKSMVSASDVSGSDVSGSDVSGADVSTADAAA